MGKSKRVNLVLAIVSAAALFVLVGCDDESRIGGGKCDVLFELNEADYTSDAATEAEHPLTWSDHGRTMRLDRVNHTVTVTYDRGGTHYVEKWNVIPPTR